MKNRSILLIACLTVFVGSCTTTTTKQRVQYAPVPASVSYQALTELTVPQPDQRIAYGNAPSQYAELWQPADPAAPVVAFIHGGCWLSAYNIKHSRAFASALRDAGFAVWAIEYRRAGEPGGGWPGSLTDIETALAALQQQPQLNLNQLALVGHSAGGHLALLAAQRSALNIDAVVGLAAITDIASYAMGSSGCEQGARAFMGGTPTQLAPAYQRANPASQPEPTIQTLLIHGTADTVVSPQQASLAGATTLLLKDAGHFDMIHPGAPAWHHILTALQQSLPSSAPSQENTR